MAILVQLIVGELKLVEGDHLFHPGSAGRRWVWMDVNARRGYGISLASDHPTRTAINNRVGCGCKISTEDRDGIACRWINKQLRGPNWLFTCETRICTACRRPAQSPSTLCSWPGGRVRRCAPGRWETSSDQSWSQSFPCLARETCPTAASFRG